MTSPLPPKRRDTRDRDDLVRHLRTNARQVGVGFMDGRFPPLRPLGSSALIGDIEDDNAGDVSVSVVGEDRDRLTLTSLSTQVWRLRAEVIPRTIVVRWHPDDGAGVEWKRDEHYTLSADGRTVTIKADALSAAGAQVDDVLSAQYLCYETSDAAVYTIDWGADGWAYLSLPSTTSTTDSSGNPTGDTTDYSMAAVYAWPVGQAPFGHDTSFSGGLPIATTQDTSLLWLRRTVDPTEAMTIRVRVEDNCIVYVNGTAVGFVPNFGSGVPGEHVFTVPDEALNRDDPNVIALRVCDEYPLALYNLYVDVRIEATVGDA